MIVPEIIQDRLTTCLEEMIARENAQKGNIQLLDPAKNVLVIVAHKGFDQDFLNHFKEVKAFDSSVCGRAMGMGAPLIVGDVTLDENFAPHRAVAAASGFRSVKSVPLVTPDRVLRGMISFHCSEPRWSWNILQPQQIFKLTEILLDFKDEL